MHAKLATDRSDDDAQCAPIAGLAAAVAVQVKFRTSGSAPVAVITCMPAPGPAKRDVGRSTRQFLPAGSNHLLCRCWASVQCRFRALQELMDNCNA